MRGCSRRFEFEPGESACRAAARNWQVEPGLRIVNETRGKFDEIAARSLLGMDKNGAILRQSAN